MFRPLILLVPLLYCTTCTAVGSEVESQQLQAINQKSEDEAAAARQALSEAAAASIHENPEAAKQITELHKAWLLQIERKCRLESFAALGRDAETATVNACLRLEYQASAQYFRHLEL